MSHRLVPQDGVSYLAPKEAVRRLAEEFAICEFDNDEGQDHVGDMLAKLIELKAPQAIIDEVAASRETAIRVRVTDDENPESENYLSLLLRSNDGPLIGYPSASVEALVRPLVERCARALGYTIVLV
jgi:hypothetical protein